MKAIGRSLNKSRKEMRPVMLEMLERLDNAASEDMVSVVEDGGLARTECSLRLSELDEDA